MIARDLRNTLASLDGRLDDVHREAVWRAIDRDVNEPAAAAAPRWRWRGFAIPTFAFAVVAAAAIVWLRPGPQPSRNQPALAQSTELVAEAGQTTKLERDGATLTLVGPGAVSIAPQRDGTLSIRVARGTLLAERTDNAPALAIAAGSNTTVTRDRTFAVHVSPKTVVLGAGAAATQIIERYVVREAAPPTIAPPAPKPPAQPPPAAETSAPRPMPRVDTAAAKADDAAAAPRAAPVLPEIRIEATELYRRAEVAMQVHDASAARDLLERLLLENPDHKLVDAARYDLALIALSAGERGKARTLLDEIILRGRDTAVRTAAETLRARSF